jgi:uridine kinase
VSVSREQLRLSWRAALAHLEGVLAGAPRATMVVAIAGPVGSGKSTLARLLAERCGGASVVSTDDYLPDYDRVPERERDLPQRADFARLAHDLASLRSGRATRVPVWSFQSHRREGEREVIPTRLIVVEGIHALHEPQAPSEATRCGPAFASLIDLRAFVEAPAAVRWARWERIEALGQRGWGVEVARTFFHEVAEPTFAKFEREYRARADVVVVNDAD